MKNKRKTRLKTWRILTEQITIMLEKYKNFSVLYKGAVA
jgi:hypothetical protein